MNKVIIAILFSASFGLSGCNTAGGFGADLEQFGGWLKGIGKKKEQTEATATTTDNPAATTTVEDATYSQPYQDPAYAPVPADVPTAITYPVEEGQTYEDVQTYPEYK